MKAHLSPVKPSARGRHVLMVGVVLLAISGFSYALASADVDRNDFVPVGAPTARDGTASRTYAVPHGIDVLDSGTIMGMYRFPNRSGDVYVLGCDDHQRFLAGTPLSPSATVLRGVTEGMFHVKAGTLPSRASDGHCASDVYVILTWSDRGDWRSNPPSAVTELVQNPEMEGWLPMVLISVGTTGILAALSGLMIQRRERRGPSGR
ncbi:MAG TPA: hypothetical protein VM889_10245 [Candidatus Thermoplasmatota archaeon]|nr:hypothetical protein [Candidatus Thermoplasmatota archaeon]